MRVAGLPREARLRHATDFAALRKPAGRLTSQSFRIRYKANGTGTPRLGLAVSRRVSKRAVERNRIKRAIRESFRRARPRLPCVDILVIARHEAVQYSGAELMAELDRLWGRVRPLKAAPAPGTIAR